MKKEILKRFKAEHVNRREFFQGTGALATLLIASQLPAYADKTGLNSYPFTLGIASGDPLPDGVVLWTRLAPDPINGWQSSRTLAVQWEVATDANMTNIIQRGSQIARPEMAHSIHVELRGLLPGHEYWYRFKAGSYVSPIGRTKTAPAAGTTPDLLKFVFVSCNDYQNGYFAAFRHIAEEDIDLIVHLGDYIYEYDPASDFPDRKHTISDPVPPGYQPDQLTTLSDYRRRHAQYKTDPALQAAHAHCPWIVTWDDHETENNYASNIDEIEGNGATSTPAAFLLQRASAYKAYYEHMPLRLSSLPVGPNAQIYRKIAFGKLAQFEVLDTRQYRTDQPYGDGLKPALGTPNGTLLGDTQEAWLLNTLDKSTAVWNILANQTMFAQFNFGAALPPAFGGPTLFNEDQWDGYPAARQRVLDFLATRKPNNPVVITGDIHSSWVHDIKANFANPASATVATELVGTSITSDFPPSFWAPVFGAAQLSPWTKFAEPRKRGYVLNTLTPQTYQADFRLVASNAKGQVSDPNAAVATAASFLIENGVPGAKKL